MDICVAVQYIEWTQSAVMTGPYNSYSCPEHTGLAAACVQILCYHAMVIILWNLHGRACYIEINILYNKAISLVMVFFVEHAQYV